MKGVEITMSKSSDVIKQVTFGWRLADNGWADTYCNNCGWTYNHDVHVGVDYMFCPRCGGSVKKDRSIYDARYTHMSALVRCGNCDSALGYYGDEKVTNMKFCPYCGDIFRERFQHKKIEV